MQRERQRRAAQRRAAGRKAWRSYGPQRAATHRDGCTTAAHRTDAGRAGAPRGADSGRCQPRDGRGGATERARSRSRSTFGEDRRDQPLALRRYRPRARERERLLARFMASQGRAMISRAADECRRAGVEFPLEQAVQLQLLEHVDETLARDAISALGRILATEPPAKRPILEQRLRRLEDSGRRRSNARGGRGAQALPPGLAADSRWTSSRCVSSSPACAISVAGLGRERRQRLSCVPSASAARPALIRRSCRDLGAARALPFLRALRALHRQLSHAAARRG